MCLREGRGANVLPLFYKRGQMSTILHLLRGQMSSPVNHLGADVLIHHFSQGGQMSEGGNVRLPSFQTIIIMLFRSLLDKSMCVYITDLGPITLKSNRLRLTITFNFMINN